MFIKKSIVTFHDFEFIHRARGLKRFILNLFWVKLPSKRATKITVISKASQEALFDLVDIPKNKVNLIYNPITIGKKSAPLKNLKFAINSFVFCIGTKANKNLETVIEVTQSNHINLVILGDLSKKQQSLLKNDSTFQNFTNVSEKHLVYLYQQAALLCFCSFEEGFGLPIIEAQYLDCPVITSNCSSMPEVAGNGALLVNPNSKEEILKAIKYVFSSEEARLELVSQGRKNAKRFAPKEIARQYIDLYNEVFEEKN